MTVFLILKKFAESNSERPFQVTFATIYRLLLGACLVTIKTTDDHGIANKSFAAQASLNLNDVDQLENTFLKLYGHRVNIDQLEFANELIQWIKLMPMEFQIAATQYYRPLFEMVLNEYQSASNVHSAASSSSAIFPPLKSLDDYEKIISLLYAEEKNKTQKGKDEMVQYERNNPPPKSSP